MKYLSVCSGIEAATVAWHQLGWEPWAFSEIEKFRCIGMFRLFGWNIGKVRNGQSLTMQRRVAMESHLRR